ncbi:hypothetical protein Dimus_015702 [Dionaea muscipula]
MPPPNRPICLINCPPHYTQLTMKMALKGYSCFFLLLGLSLLVSSSIQGEVGGGVRLDGGSVFASMAAVGYILAGLRSAAGAATLLLKLPLSTRPASTQTKPETHSK